MRILRILYKSKGRELNAQVSAWSEYAFIKREVRKMKKNVMKKIALMLAIVMMMSLTFGTAASAAQGDTYLSLGSDLTAEQQGTVLKLLGVDDISQYDVMYITNADEHQYLDKYVSASQIGSRALSSVLIKETGGDDIDVETYNISFCTEGMYENALKTAGVTGAEVTVAGPMNISGTAALVGTIKAYEKMTGEVIKDEVIEGAVDEITTTGEIGESIGDKEKAEDIISEVKEEIGANPNMSEDEIIALIKKEAQKVGVTLSDEDIQKAMKMLKNLQNLDIDWDKLGNVIKEHSGFISRIVNWFLSLFN